MRNEWASEGVDPTSTLGADLHLELAGTGLRSGLMTALREAVRTGRLASGTRLPSSRALAADLGVARNTVADAYAELIAEGWLTAKQGSATRVAKRSQPPGTPSTTRSTAARARPTYGLLPGWPNLAEFPRAQWLSAARRALTSAPDDAFGYGDAAGRIDLRAAVAEYLSRSRGVYAEPQRVVICAGFHQGLTLMAWALKARGVRAVAVESYGFDVYRGVLNAAGLHTPPLFVDEQGARTTDLAGLRGVGAVLLTPAHQYPTGVELRPDRRAAAIDWARATGGLVLEDDYDGEFRYDRHPVGALQGLDPARVAYFGSVSKSLAPGLRLAWVVLPEDLVPEVVGAKGNVDWSSALEQLTLAEFIASGAYDRHVRAMRNRYRLRRDQLATTVAKAAPRTRVTGIAAGLQAVLELPQGSERSVVQAASDQGLWVQGLGEFRFDSPDTGWKTPRRDGLVVGFAAPSDSAWSGALEALCRILP
ncbi:GntR family transcriptional regulator [Mycobacterium sp. ACS1612]|uniref:MocR-like pyridoxine biosynthesis transcription factor PdxR n=1 Tax=Mycobacterium sp. ACS1612 TaxID=1834117 RepID=UPI000801A7BF|nr:PLP-dependent aminotransferase family protein [Mycobacterium sp. ACS1612]OBF28440.1 GntR family transcriptional regulator [Mycobacterium sp. ACS1612]